jgi:uncharacterized protein YqeY
MELEKKINDDIKQAMLSKDSRKLAALRAIKAALLLEKTGKDVTAGVIPDEVELKMLQKLVKQRREAAAIYVQQNRPDLAEEETYQATIIEAYLPAKLSEEELRNMIAEAIKTTGASGIKEMGKVMGLVSKQVAGRADNSLIATLVKEMLS